MRAPSVPRVWIVASHRPLPNEYGQPQPYTLVDEGALHATIALGLQPASYPYAPAARVPELLDEVHGVFLGGSATNVDPRRYGEAPVHDDLAIDREREAVSFPLVRLCIERGVPLIGVCRGAQEINVALGGSLHQDVQARDGSVGHSEDPDDPLDEQYADRHAVSVVTGGRLAALTGEHRLAVSSLHKQGVRRLAEGLVVEAIADDGLVEAFRWHDDSRFAWGFQFHPEWRFERKPPYAAIMSSFANACRLQCDRAARQARR